jgi:hypothetical protein
LADFLTADLAAIFMVLRGFFAGLRALLRRLAMPNTPMPRDNYDLRRTVGENG